MADETLFELRAEFDVNMRMTPGESRRIGRMYQLYGHGPDGAVCRDCVSIRSAHHNSGKYTKCVRFGISRGPGTDWRQRWAACGKFEQRPTAPRPASSTTIRRRRTTARETGIGS